MKPSALLLCFAPTIAFAAAEPLPHAVAPSPSQPNAPLRAVPDVRTALEDEPEIPSGAQAQAQQRLHVPVADTQTKPDTMSIPLFRRTALSLRRRSSAELTKRSEGTLGQTPWIGMAIGLTCTTMAAVMLG
ncbi:hypothetical protein BDV18DRAFT_135732 [Aspergillus unguis]